MTDAQIRLWGRDIAAVTWDDRRELGVFQYMPEFVGSGIQVAPLTMPLRDAPYQFPSLSVAAFRRLPGLIADSLPDKFGNAVINAWLARQGRTPESFDPVERLCYIGTRGLGALEFQPMLKGTLTAAGQIRIDALVELANQILDQRKELHGKLSGDDDEKAMEDILEVGTSAGGARAKAIVAWNESTDEFRSSQLPAGDGFSNWILKFDGVRENRDREVLADPQGYGRIELAYHKMATATGIEMTRCRLHFESGRAHFMTKRFDRTDDGDKIHMQTLGALMHYDFNLAGACSYEQAIQAMRRLGLSRIELEQQFLRTVFNVMGRNHDDHVKNISFLMDRRGQWQLSPAYDVTYAYNPPGAWTARHQMSIQGKREKIDLEDLLALASMCGIKSRSAKSMISRVQSAIQNWPSFAEETGVPQMAIQRIDRTLLKKWID